MEESKENSPKVISTRLGELVFAGDGGLDA